MSAQRIEIHPSAAETANGATTGVAIPKLTMIMVGIDITAGSGTITDFTAYLQGSDDNGTTWYDLVADQVLPTVDAAAGGTVTTDDRDIIDGKATTTAEKFMAVYKHLPADKVRLVWKLSGATPSLTFSASIVGK